MNNNDIELIVVKRMLKITFYVLALYTTSSSTRYWSLPLVVTSFNQYIGESHDMAARRAGLQRVANWAVGRAVHQIMLFVHRYLETPDYLFIICVFT